MIRALLLGIGILCLGATVQAKAADSALIGNWARQDGETKIKISPCGTDVCAVNTWVRDPKGDEKLGDVLVMTLEPKSPTELSGRAHDNRRGMTYSMKISLGGSGMQTHGCVLLGILCKTAEWTRIQ